MNRKQMLANAILWAAAIAASAVLDAPTFLSLILLPCLAVCSLLATPQMASRR